MCAQLKQDVEELQGIKERYEELTQVSGQLKEKDEELLVLKEKYEELVQVTAQLKQNVVKI